MSFLLCLSPILSIVMGLKFKKKLYPYCMFSLLAFENIVHYCFLLTTTELFFLLWTFIYLGFFLTYTQVIPYNLRALQCSSNLPHVKSVKEPLISFSSWGHSVLSHSCCLELPPPPSWEVPSTPSCVCGLLLFCSVFVFVFLDALHSLQGLSSLTRDWTRGHGSESTES